MKPLVSVIISCYNYGRYVDKALRSAFDSTYDNIEIVIINDASTDDSDKVISDFIKNNQKQSVQYSYLKNDRNMGAAGARNRAVRSANGTYVMIVDADDWIDPNYIKEAVRIAETNPSISPVYSDVWWKGDSDKMKVAPDWSVARLKKGPFIHSTSLIRREAWLKIGGMDANLKAWMDYDVFIRLAIAGYKGVRIPKPYSYYRRRIEKDPSYITAYAAKNINSVRKAVRRKHIKFFR